MGLLVATDRFDVDLLGRLALELEPVVPCRCMLAGDADEGREGVDGVELGGIKECLCGRLGFATRGF